MSKTMARSDAERSSKKRAPADRSIREIANVVRAQLWEHLLQLSDAELGVLLLRMRRSDQPLPWLSWLRAALNGGKPSGTGQED